MRDHVTLVPEVCAPKGGGWPSIQNSRVVSHYLLGEGEGRSCEIFELAGLRT